MFDFVGKRNVWFGISALLLIPSFVFLGMGGLKPGIDFTGGSELELRITDANNIQEALYAQAEVEELALVSVVPAEDNHYLLRFEDLNQSQVSGYVEKLQSGLGEVEQVSFIDVGPTISGDLGWQAVVDGIAMPLRLFGVNVNSSNISQAIGGVFWASLAIAAYIAYSFRKIPAPYSSWAFGLSAIIALLHDIVIVLGVFAILGYFFGTQIDTSFVTALLTVIGFSVHDTIVVFDRVRENVHRYPTTSFAEVMNFSIAETAGRSIGTSVTVVFVLAALVLLGGDSIRMFVLALLVGVVIGTYSSIFNAGQILAWWEGKKEGQSRIKIKPSTPKKSASAIASKVVA